MRHSLLKNITIILICIVVKDALAQVQTVENAVFWEVSGNELQKSSYLLGSHHLMDSQYVDSLQNVSTKFDSSSIFVCEVLFDSAQTLKMISAATMKDSTLQQLLPPGWYRETEIWLRDISPYDSLSVFDQFNPLTIQMMILEILRARVNAKTYVPMDIYLENRARSGEKELTALETIDEQLNALFYSTTYRRQAEILINFVRHRETAEQELTRIRQLYLRQNLFALEMDARNQWSGTELAVMLDERNKRWLRTLPEIFRRGSAFVVVGALHLSGENGIVNQLRQLGFSVTPIALYSNAD